MLTSEETVEREWNACVAVGRLLITSSAESSMPSLCVWGMKENWKETSCGVKKERERPAAGGVRCVLCVWERAVIHASQRPLRPGGNRQEPTNAFGRDGHAKQCRRALDSHWKTTLGRYYFLSTLCFPSRFLFPIQIKQKPEQNKNKNTYLEQKILFNWTERPTQEPWYDFITFY